LDARNAGEDPLSAIERVLPWDDFVASLEETKLLAIDSSGGEHGARLYWVSSRETTILTQ
ncbi:TPA: hypothetical protein ACF37L_004426, partial [Escherichia coli]|nr:hypothetical protein [Escherichia coli]